MEVFLRFPTLAYHLNGIANYGEYSGNKMLENQELQRLIEKNVNAYLATVGGEGARYYGGQAQVMLARFQAERGQSYPRSNTTPSGYLPADGTAMGGVGTEITQNSQELSEVTTQSNISWGGSFNYRSSNEVRGPVLITVGLDIIPKNSKFAKAIWESSRWIRGSNPNTSIPSLIARRFLNGKPPVAWLPRSISLGGQLGRFLSGGFVVLGTIITAYDLYSDYQLYNEDEKKYWQQARLDVTTVGMYHEQ